MQTIGNNTFLSTPELAARLGMSPRTLVEWANRKHPAANWNNYSHQWEWNLELYLAWKLERREKPAKANGNAVETAKPKRGRKAQFKVVK